MNFKTVHSFNLNGYSIAINQYVNRIYSQDGYFVTVNTDLGYTVNSPMQFATKAEAIAWAKEYATS